MNYRLGVCLPTEQAEAELAELEPEMKARGIVLKIHDIRGGKIIMIADEQMHLLPKDEKGPYFGDDDSGHSIYPIDLPFWKSL